MSGVSTGVANFYPRPPGGGRLWFMGIRRYIHGISIHALRVEGDQARQLRGFSQQISIHALRVEGDPSKSVESAIYHNFYPRPPGGGRPGKRDNIRPARQIFLSTPSGWRATYHLFSDCPLIRISIHALRVEGDLIRSAIYSPLRISIHALRVEGDPRRGRPHLSLC